MERKAPNSHVDFQARFTACLSPSMDYSLRLGI
jgi:hypothetical protein